jgi:Leucine-rich repeat (LRR) protein
VTISRLEWVYSLTFVGFKGVDLSGLKNIVILDISESRKVLDVTTLDSLQTLNITGCDGIRSLSGLSKLKELTLDGRNKISISTGAEFYYQLTICPFLGSTIFCVV